MQLILFIFVGGGISTAYQKVMLCQTSKTDNDDEMIFFVFQQGHCGNHRVVNSCKDLAERQSRLHVHGPEQT